MVSMKVKHSRNLWQWFRTPLVATDLETQLLKQDQTTEKVIQKIDLCTWLGYVLIFFFVSLTLVNPMLRINGLAIAFLAWLMICSWVKLDKKRKNRSVRVVYAATTNQEMGEGHWLRLDLHYV